MMRDKMAWLATDAETRVTKKTIKCVMPFSRVPRLGQSMLDTLDSDVCKPKCFSICWP